jgi:hypothetical protein
MRSKMLRRTQSFVTPLCPIRPAKSNLRKARLAKRLSKRKHPSDTKTGREQQGEWWLVVVCRTAKLCLFCGKQFDAAGVSVRDTWTPERRPLQAQAVGRGGGSPQIVARDRLPPVARARLVLPAFFRHEYRHDLR